MDYWISLFFVRSFCFVFSLQIKINLILVYGMMKILVSVQLDFRFDSWQPWMEGRISTAPNTQSKSVPYKWCRRLRNAKFSVWNVRERRNETRLVISYLASWPLKSFQFTCCIVSMPLEWCLDPPSSNRFGCQTWTHWWPRSNSNRPCWRRIFPDLVAIVSSTFAAHCCSWSTSVRL